MEMVMIILGAATLANGLMKVVDLAEQPQKKNRPRGGTRNRSGAGQRRSMRTSL